MADEKPLAEPHDGLASTQQRYPEQRTINDKIARLRERVKRHENEPGRDKFIVGVLLGILDLLGDEL